MRYVLSLAALTAMAALATLWLNGGLDRLAVWAASEQRAFQSGIARSLRAIRAGDAGAVAALLMGCFAYGLVHAAGPGHGKVLIGGYGFARRVPMLRLSLIALLASLGQAITAIILVYAGVLIFNAGREAMVSTTEALMAPLSYAAIALIGAWLCWRGVRKLLTGSATHHRHRHNHNHAMHGAACASCGHAHGPTLEEVERVGNLREAVVLIGGIALRPCTGALFVLIITWQMGIGVMGIAGTVAMALGTGLVTVAVGLAAGTLRGGMLAAFTGSRGLARAMAGIELLAGGVVVIIAVGLLLRAI